MIITAEVSELTRKIKLPTDRVLSVNGDYQVDGIAFKLPATYEGDFDFSTAAARVHWTGVDKVEHTNLITEEDGNGYPMWIMPSELTQGGHGVIEFAISFVATDETAAITKRWISDPVSFRNRRTVSGSNEDEEAEEKAIYDRLASAIAAVRAAQASVDDVAEVLSSLGTLTFHFVDAKADMTDQTKLYVLTTDGYLYYYSTAASDFVPAFEVGGSQEVIDARTDENGTTYANLKTRINTGFTQLKEDLSDILSELEAIHDSVEQLPIGLPEAQKTLIISIMRNALYSTDMSADINALEDSFFADIPATAVTLNKTSAALEGTESQVALVATPVPLNTTDVVVWASSNPTIATVDSNGLVTAVATGTCSITATVGTVSATCSVTVSMVSIVSIDAVYTQTGIVYTTDSLDNLKEDLVVTARLSNDTITTVDSYDYTLSGTLTAGTSTITVTYAGCTDTFTVTVTQKNLDSIAYENKSYRDIFMTGNMLTGTDFENGIPTGWNTSAGSPETTDEAYVSASRSLKLFMTGSSGSQTGALVRDIGWTTESGKVYYDAVKLNCVRFNSGIRFGLFTGSKANYLSVTAATDGWVTLDKYYTATGSNPPFGDRVFMGATGTLGSNPSDMDGYVDDIVHICLTDLFESEPNKSVINRLYEEYCTLRNGGAV